MMAEQAKRERVANELVEVLSAPNLFRRLVDELVEWAEHLVHRTHPSP